MKPKQNTFAARAIASIGAAALALGLGSLALGESNPPATAGAMTPPKIGQHELMVITDDGGRVLDVMEYVYVGVDGAQLVSSPVTGPADTDSGAGSGTEPREGALPLAALRVAHAGLPLAQADLASLPASALNQAALLDQVQQGLSGLDSALPSLPGVYQVSGEVATIAQYQAAFAQLHQAYTDAGLDDVETQVRDLDQNGLSDVLLDVLDSGLAPPDFVEFWETFDAQPFFDTIDTAEGDFDHLLDALMLNEQGFQELLTAHGFTLAGFLERLAQRQLPPAYLIGDAVAYAADPGAFIDWVMAEGDGPDAVAQVPLMAERAVQDRTGDQSQADSASQVAWQVLGEMGKIGAPIDLIARMKGRGLDPHGDHQPAIDGGLQPRGGMLDPDAPGKAASWSYDVKTYRISPGGWTLISDVALDLDATACAQYSNLSPAPGQFARQWQLYLSIADGDPAIMLSPSQQANRGSYLDGRNTGKPADVLQVSLERIPLAITPETGQNADQAGAWGGRHRHELDLLITGDGWTYLLNSLPPDEGGRLPPANLARLVATRTEATCNPHPGVDTPSNDPHPNKDIAGPADGSISLPPKRDHRHVGPRRSANVTELSASDSHPPDADLARQRNQPSTQARHVGANIGYGTGGRYGVTMAFYKGQQFYFRTSFIHGNQHALEVFPAAINDQGFPERAGPATEIHWPKDDGRPLENIKATIARDCLYVSWTNPEGADTAAWVKWSCDNGSHWFPKAGPQHIGTIPGKVRSVALSSYAERKPDAGNAIEWLVLLYTTDADPAHIGVLANSGAQWVGGHKYRIPWNNGEWHSLAALSVVGSEGDEVILVAATTSGDGAGANDYLMRVQTFNGTWHTKLRYTALAWTKHDGDLAMAPGTLGAPSPQNQRMVQIFGANSGVDPYLRHYEFPLAGKYAEQGYLQGPVNAGFPLWYPHKGGLSAAAGFKKTDEGVRQYITVAATHDFSSNIETNTFPSDRFISLGLANERDADTAVGANKLRSAWTLLGVIEGVPPFTRNGLTINEPDSKVIYGVSEENTLTIKNSYTFDITVGIGGDTSPVSSEVGYGIELARSSTETKTLTIESSFDNRITGGNVDGEYGWLLFAQPKLNNNRYRWLAADGQHELGIINQLVVPDFSIGSEAYQLRGDPNYPGLPKRWPSSDPRAWRKGLKPDEGIPADQKRIILQCLMDPSNKSEGKKCSFSRARTEMAEVNQQWSFELSQGISDYLKLTAKSTVGLSNTIETTKTQYGEAYIEQLPSPAPGFPSPIDKLYVTGNWIEADPDSGEQPYWVPDEFKFQRPWLLTWRVGAVYPDDEGKVDIQTLQQMFNDGFEEGTSE